MDYGLELRDLYHRCPRFPSNALITRASFSEWSALIRRPQSTKRTGVLLRYLGNVKAYFSTNVMVPLAGNSGYIGV